MVTSGVTEAHPSGRAISRIVDDIEKPPGRCRSDGRHDEGG